MALRRLVVLVVLAQAVVGCGGESLPGAPPGLEAMLAAMPAAAAERGLYYTDLTRTGPEEGFGIRLPFGEDPEQVFGFSLGEVQQVLESGEPPATLLRGEFDPTRMAAAFTAQGYTVNEAGGWTAFERGNGGGRGDPVTVAVPAAAFRGDLLLLATVADVERVTTGAPSALATAWAPRLARVVGVEATSVALGPPPIEAARRLADRQGGDLAGLLERAGVRRPLASYEGYAVSRDALDNGVIALAFAPGSGSAADAAALAGRVATSTLLDDPTQRPADDLEAGGPRWLQGARLVVLPVSWARFDGPRLRDDLQRGAFGALVPAP